MRRLARGLRRYVTRTLYPRRRIAALRLIQNGDWRSIVFVCLGNVCRSALAEFVFLERLPESLKGRITVESAGFIGPDRPSPELAVEVAREMGFDLTAHRSKLLVKTSDASRTLYVVVDPRLVPMTRRTTDADRTQVLLLGDIDPDPRERRAIEDPWGQPKETFETAFRDVERCLDVLLTSLDSAPMGGTKVAP